MVIAVLDSGINEDYYANNDFVCDAIGYEYQNGNVFKSTQKESIYDHFGHGTMCIDCIHRLQPDAKILSVKILNDEGKTSSEVLEKALLDLISSNVDIINLSLSLTDKRYTSLEEICRALTDSGKLIVAACENNSDYSIPAIFNSVIGVSGRQFNSVTDFIVNLENPIELICDRSPIIVRNGLNKFDLFKGNSKATCVATAMVSGIVSSNKNYAKNEILRRIKDQEKPVSYVEETYINEPRPREDVLKMSEDVPSVEEFCCTNLGCNVDDLYTSRIYEFPRTDSAFIVALIEKWCGKIKDEDVITYKHFEWFYSPLFVGRV